MFRHFFDQLDLGSRNVQMLTVHSFRLIDFRKTGTDNDLVCSGSCLNGFSEQVRIALLRRAGKAFDILHISQLFQLFQRLIEEGGIDMRASASLKPRFLRKFTDDDYLVLRF